MTRTTYTPQERQQALELYATDGPTAVQRELGIPKHTVASWASRAGLTTVRNEKNAAAVDAARLSWEERRIGLAHKLGEVAELAADLAREKLEDGLGRDAQAAATTSAICVDKAQLLTGAVTSRHEHRHVDAVDAELSDLAGQLEARSNV